MREALPVAEAAARARIIGCALALGRSIDLWSLVLVAVALAVLLGLSLPLAPRICLLASVLAGAAQKIVALRVAFDARLFRDWSETWTLAASQRPDPAGLDAEFAALDQLLAIGGLRAPASGPQRDLDSRLRGAWRLLRQQLVVFAMQFAAMLAALIAVQLAVAGEPID